MKKIKGERYLFAFRGLAIELIIILITLIVLSFLSMILVKNIVTLFVGLIPTLCVFIPLILLPQVTVLRRICIYEKGIHEINLIGKTTRYYEWNEIAEIRVGRVKRSLADYIPGYPRSCIVDYTVIYFCARPIVAEDLDCEVATIKPEKRIVMIKYRKAAMDRIEEYSGKKVIWMVDKISYY